jgi:hypothetical protein
MIVVIIVILIIFIILITYCATHWPIQECFTNEFNIETFIKKDLSQFNNFNKESLKNFFHSNIDKTAMVEIEKNGTYKISYSKENEHNDNLKYFKEMMKKLHKLHNLPPCLFIISFQDQSISDYLPIFQNSIPKNQKGVLYPLWYYFSKKKIQYTRFVPWFMKYNKAVWRGSSTGKTPTRMEIVDLSKKYPGLVNAQFTNLVQKSGEMLKQKGYKEKNTLDPGKQCMYKYIISADGNGGTYGLYWTLRSGSCILNNTNYRQWFSPFFKENRDYIPFNNPNEIPEIIKNTKNGNKIANNSKNIANKIFNEPFILHYMHQLIVMYSIAQSKNGVI